MKNVMVDLETLGTVPGCSILSIGAVFFDRDGLGGEFYTPVNRDSCAAAGLHEDPGTLAWWNERDKAARAVLSEAANTLCNLPEALLTFNEYIRERCPGVKVWGNGADFDNAILHVAYRAVGLTPAWAFTNNRCYRALKGIAPGPKLVRVGTYHNALDDAKSQALHAIELFRAHPTLVL